MTDTKIVQLELVKLSDDLVRNTVFGTDAREVLDGFYNIDQVDLLVVDVRVPLIKLVVFVIEDVNIGFFIERRYDFVGMVADDVGVIFFFTGE